MREPRQRALPWLQESFMEAKMAFQTLSDERARADYDRKLRMVRMGSIKACSPAHQS